MSAFHQTCRDRRRSLADIECIADGPSMIECYRQCYVLEDAIGSTAIRYVCYEDLRTGKFCVSSGEVLTAPETGEMLSWLWVNEVDHFINEGPRRWFDTLLEAVEDFAPNMENERGR